MPRGLYCVHHPYSWGAGYDALVQDDLRIRGTAQESKTALFELFYTSRRMNRKSELAGRHEEGVAVTPFTLFSQS
jgi:hypothetical protein